MTWIILLIIFIAIVGVSLFLYRRFILAGGNYIVITKNVTSWYVAFLLINDCENNPNLRVASLLEAAAIGSQNASLKLNRISLAEIKASVSKVVEESGIAEIKWVEIKPSVETEFLCSLITELMVLIFLNDFKNVEPYQIIINIEQRKGLIRETIYKHLQKKPSTTSIVAAKSFAREHPDYLDGIYAGFK